MSDLISFLAASHQGKADILETLEREKHRLKEAKIHPRQADRQYEYEFRIREVEDAIGLLEKLRSLDATLRSL